MKATSKIAAEPQDPMKVVALLRGVNVGGNRKVPMPKLITLAENSGFTEVKSYINSGNIVFEVTKKKIEQVCPTLEKAIEHEFGFKVDVIVRSVSQWKNYSKGSPFPTAESSRPKMVHLGLSKQPFDSTTLQKLSEKALFGEKIKIVGDAIWVDFAKSVGKSKLTPAVFDKAAGSIVTMRNWNTVLKLWELLDE